MTTPEVRGWRRLNLAVGIWLIASPFVLRYGANDSRWIPPVFGTMLVLLALLTGDRSATRVAGTNACLGAWLALSAWWLADSAAAVLNETLCGGIVVALAVVGLGLGDRDGQPPRRG